MLALKIKTKAEFLDLLNVVFSPSGLKGRKSQLSPQCPDPFNFTVFIFFPSLQNFLQPLDIIMAQNQETGKPWWAADNASMRPYYGRPHKLDIHMLKDKDKRPSNSCYILRDRNGQPNPTSIHLDTIMNSASPPRTRTELFERAGATFFSHCKVKLKPIVSWWS